MPDRPSDEKLLKFNSDRLHTRLVDELIGIARGIVADNVLTDGELDMLVRWLVAHREITDDPIAASLYRRIRVMLSDGVFSDEERTELLETLKSFTGPRFEIGEPLTTSTAIPYCHPVPPLGFAGWRYCFTGTFNYGTREICEEAVIGRGAQAGSLTKYTDALVVGHYATDSWLHSSYGLKIIKAVGMQGNGHHILIVPELAWAGQL